MASKVMHIILIIIIFSSSGLFSISFLNQNGYAHSIDKPSQQRIGNYEFEMATQPPLPIVGKPADILLRVSTIDGEELIDTLIRIKIEKDGQAVHTTSPIVVTGGHYTYRYTFAQDGQYNLYIDLNDPNSNNTTTFTFPLNVISETTSYLISWSIPITGAVIVSVAAIVALRLIRKNKTKIGNSQP